MRRLLHKFKYGLKTLLTYPFCELIASFIQSYHFDIDQFDVIVPIPLSSTRLRERGYNQSQLLAEEIAHYYNIHLSINNLIKVLHTKNQANLSRKNRWTNVQRAFKIKTPNEYRQKAVLIIDDLLTTGATASEAGHMLKIAGAKTVGVLTLAIAPQEK